MIPSVAVVIVNWNGREVTLDCLRSLHRAHPAPDHVLVVDNASADGSREAIAKEFPRVELIAEATNLRFAGGNNVGIRRALELGAEAILLLNNDTVVEPEFLAPLAAPLAGDPACGMVAPKILYYDDPSRIWFAGGEIAFWTGTMRHVGIRHADDGAFDRPGVTGYATGCCVLVRSTVVQKIGGLDESYFMYAEDADWSMRVRDAGFTILYEPASRIFHKVSVSAGGHLSWFKLRHKYLSTFRFFSRHARWYHWLVFPWLGILVNGGRAAAYLLQRGVRKRPGTLRRKAGP